MYLPVCSPPLQPELHPDSVRVVAKGSYVKGTFLWGSDIDLIIDTPFRSLSRGDKEALVKFLRTMSPDFSTVSLKKVAIHWLHCGLDFDLVFAKTEEYGNIPITHNRLANNKEAQDAACMSKLAMEKCAFGISGFVLELIVIQIQRHQPNASSTVLFLDTLQRLVDTNGNACNTIQEELKSPTTKENFMGSHFNDSAKALIKTHAQMLLHIFCVSRFYPVGQPGFSDVAQMEYWLRSLHNFTGGHMCVLGPVPTWLLDKDHPRLINKLFNNGKDLVIPALETTDIRDVTEADRRTAEIISADLISVQAAEIFLEGPFAKYTMAGVFPKQGADHRCNLFKHIQLLEASRPDSLAERMLLARYTWVKGENSLSMGDPIGGIRLLATALEISCTSEGDPFSGVWIADDGRYIDAANFVLKHGQEHGQSVHAIGALFVRANYLMSCGKYSEAQMDLALLLKIDAKFLPALITCFTINGNCGNWKEGLSEVNHCISLAPTHPILYFWRSVMNRNIEETHKSTLAQQRKDLEHFVCHASPSGRKICQAWYELSLVCIAEAFDDETEESFVDALVDVKNNIQSAKKAERDMLPYLRQHESCKGSSKVKLLVEDMLRMVPAGVPPEMRTKGVPTKSNTMQACVRESANKLFRHKNYDEAIEGYSSCIQHDDTDYRSWSNRSAAYEALGRFSEAAEDAKQVIHLQPKWPKGFWRLGRALIGRADPKGALTAAQDGMNALSGDVVGGNMLSELKQEAQQLVEKIRVCAVVSVPKLRCWDGIKYKRSVYIVSKDGNGHFTTLADAVYSCPLVPSSIVLLEGNYEINHPLICARNSALQIIANGHVEIHSSVCSHLITHKVSGL
jgi:tetratricopeptide (TPR) repeat protein